MIAGKIIAGLLGLFDHAEGDTILQAAPGVAHLQLGPDLGPVSRCEAVQTDDSCPANQFERAICH